MASITSRIREAAPRNRELRQILSQTRYSRRLLENKNQQIAILDGILRHAQRETQCLARTTESALQLFQAHHRSPLRRAVYWAAGRDQTYVHTMEQNYLTAQLQQLDAQLEEQGLQVQRAAMLVAQHSLEEEVRQRTQARHEHEDLLDYVFQGPTPEFPEHADLEQRAEAALCDYHNSTAKMECEQELLQLLMLARDKARLALCKINAAHPKINEAHPKINVMVLRGASEALDETEVLITRAWDTIFSMAEASPEDERVWLVRSTPSMVAVPGIPFLYFIRICRAEVREFLAGLDEQCEVTRSRCCDLALDTEEKLQQMTAAKARLRAVRKRIFAEVLDELDEGVMLPLAVGGGEEAAYDDPPPSYSSLFLS